MARSAPNQKTPPPSDGRRRFVWIFLAAALALALTAALCLNALSPFPMLEVAGHRITQEEYLQAMYRARNDVLSDHAAAGISLKDWNADTTLGNPYELITQRTLKILSEYYAVSDLAVERGYLADASYDSMLRDMDAYNRRRQEALESGAVITGIPQFTTADYITYRASNFRIQFTNDENNPETQVTPEEIRQHYEADKDNLYALPDDLELGYLVIDVSTDEADTLETDLEALRQLALEKGSIALALEEMPQLKDYYEEISVDRRTYSVYARSHADILACAAQLQSGDISEVFRQGSWFCLVQCHQRTQHNYAPLEDVQSVVVQSIRENRYDSLIAERIKDTEIKVDLPALLRFTAEQFN